MNKINDELNYSSLNISSTIVPDKCREDYALLQTILIYN